MSLPTLVASAIEWISTCGSLVMTDNGVVPPDHLKLLAAVLEEYCSSTSPGCTEDDREYVALRLSFLYQCGLKTREALLSKLESERGRVGQ